ncbi:MAG: hypothetical protein KAU27_15035, partial [Desulfuromonadales bacterium]|nr:hypothetical protein [Desulfuromonadales bacterium]
MQQETPVQEKPAPEVTPVTLLQEAIKVSVVETATAALPIWQKYAPLEPTLILFSNDPFLVPVPEELHTQAIELVRNGSVEEIQARAVNITPNPLLLHSMAVDVALKAGFFSELIWILPSNNETPLPPLEEFRQGLLDANLINQTEAESLIAQDGVFTGYFRDIPVTIGNLSAIPQSKNPAWVHFDLSFIKPLYKNEVSTPLYPLLMDALGKISRANLSSVGATVSHSNFGGNLSLKTRFLGQDIAHIFSSPSSLKEALPELQARRAQNLYLENFFKKEEILENCLAMEKLAPKDATVKFDIYNIQRTHKQGNLALEALGQAVALDPV